MNFPRLFLGSICLLTVACERAPSQPAQPEPPVEESAQTPEQEQTVEPAAPSTDCPGLAVTVDGRPYEAASALAWRITTDDGLTGHRVMLTDENITCRLIMDHYYSPDSYVSAFASNQHRHYHSVNVRGGGQQEVSLEVVLDPDQPGEQLAICVREPVTFVAEEGQEYSIVGLFSGEFCGDRPYLPR